jgi:hypothetical protein
MNDMQSIFESVSQLELDQIEASVNVMKETDHACQVLKMLAYNDLSEIA